MKNDLFRFASNAGTIISILLFFLAVLGYQYVQDDILAKKGLSPFMKWSILFGLIYIGAQFLAALIDMLQSRVKATLKNLMLLWLTYLVVTFLNLFILFLCLPILVFSFLLGPALGLAGILAICLIFVYLYHHLIDSTAIANPPTHQELFILVGSVIVAFGFLYLLFKKNADPESLLDRFIDAYVANVYEPAKAWNENLLQYLDK